MEKSTIYTKKGDKGTTSLYGGSKVLKTDAHIEVVGSLDELNASLGVAESRITNLPARQAGAGHELREIIFEIQNLLFNIGAEVADVDHKITIKKVSATHTKDLEGLIDYFDAQLPQLTTFILPGGSSAGAEFHRARAVCRRAERALVRLATNNQINPEIQRFLNRLGDFLFVFARYVNQLADAPETRWRK